MRLVRSKFPVLRGLENHQSLAGKLYVSAPINVPSCRQVCVSGWLKDGRKINAPFFAWTSLSTSPAQGKIWRIALLTSPSGEQFLNSNVVSNEFFKASPITLHSTRISTWNSKLVSKWGFAIDANSRFRVGPKRMALTLLEQWCLVPTKWNGEGTNRL